MQDESQPERPEDIAERLHDVVDRMLKPHGMGSSRSILGLDSVGPPFDISKPNQHDSKAEFLREKKAVESSAAQLDEIVGVLSARDKLPENIGMRTRLRGVLDQKIRSDASRTSFDSATGLIRRNVAEIGGYYMSLIIMLDLEHALHERLIELEEQEEKFWNLSHRAPDYYAQAIALRLAKLFARRTGQFPTVGSSGETGEPSTTYTRALRDAFEILGIETGVRLPADWALKQLTDDDRREPQNKLAGWLGGFQPGDPRNTLLGSLMSRDEESNEN